MFKLNKQLKQTREIAENNTLLLNILIDYVVKNKIIYSDFVEYCNIYNFDELLLDISINEKETELFKDDLHAGGIEATITLGKMAGLKSGMLVLDAGTGYGGAGRILVENFKCNVIGIDNNFPRLLNALIRTKKNRLSDFFSFEYTNAYKMNFEDGKFDVIFRQYSVYGGNEIDFIMECNRVLKECGVIAFHGTFKNINIKQKDKLKLEDYSFREYKKILEENNFKIIEIEIENSTKELLNSYKKNKVKSKKINQTMIELIEHNMIIGFKLVAQKLKNNLPSKINTNI